ncbi:MAG: ATP-binding cassette domain-containing protein [Rhodobacteraceae bacterium]|nr:ATP-binding cassette domain-containing protein [Paracoccaceae bacterium]
MAYIVVLSGALAAVLLSIPIIFGDFTAYQIGLFLIYGIAAQGIGFLWGKTGILPLGQAMFFGVSAYVCAHILLGIESLFLQILALIAALIVIASIAFVLAAVIFRGRSESGPYFSLITLALVMIAEQVSGTATGLTGGFNGVGGFNPIAGLDQFGSLYYLIVAVVIITTASLLLIDKLPAALIARAIADNEPRLRLLGFPSHLIKGAVFAFSAILAALAGILFASHQGIVTPTSTGFLLSANFVIWTAVGGRNHVLGPLIGAVLIGYLSSELRDSFQYWEVLLACLFILVVLKAPGGLAELFVKLFNRIFPASNGSSATSNIVPATHIQSAPAALKFREVRVKVGAVKILDNVDFTTPQSGILCIIGPNGAGKTSLLNVITGGLSVVGGAVKIDGNSVENRPPYMALKSGIGRKLQVPSVFFSMTVFENLSISMMAGRASLLDYFKPSTLKWRSDQLDTLLAIDRLPLIPQMNTSVAELPQGHRQFLEFAMTTAAVPRILLLDEPCAGLSPEETKLMTSIVRDFQKTSGGLVILIEHDMSIVQSLSDKVLVLHQGEVLAHGSYTEIKADKNVNAVYVGGSK